MGTALSPQTDGTALTFSDTVTQSDLNASTGSPQFTFLDDPGYFYLDNVCLEAPSAVVPEPGTAVMAVIGVYVTTIGVGWHRKQRPKQG